MIKLEMTITKKMWDRIQKGLNWGKTDDNMLELPAAEVQRRIEEYRAGQDIFQKGVKILAESLLRQLPPTICSEDGVCIQLIAKRRKRSK